MFDSLIDSYIHSEIQAGVLTRRLSEEEARQEAFRALCEFKGVPEVRDELELAECLFAMLSPEEQARRAEMQHRALWGLGVCLACGVVIAALVAQSLGIVGGIASALLACYFIYGITSALWPTPSDLIDDAVQEFEAARRQALQACCAELRAQG